MPSRWQCLLIVAFWLGAIGWLYVRELEPNYRDHDPPPYVIELTAETQTIHPSITWKVFQNDQAKESYVVKTWMDHRELDDSFALHSQVKPAQLQDEAVKANLPIQEMDSEYRVSREGRLMGLTIEGEFSRRPIPGFPNLDIGFKPQMKLTAMVVQGSIIAHLKLPQGVLRESESNFQFPVSQNGTVFLPLHPVHKIHGVRPAKTWLVPQLDPLGAAAKAWLRKYTPFEIPTRSERILSARVREQPEEFPYDMGDGATHRCWVIDYTDLEDDKQIATTWVEVDTDLVLCQEARLDSGQMRLVRDSTSSRIQHQK